jgi:hypothetical protein
MNKVRRSQTAPGGWPSKSAERSDRAGTARAADRHGRCARLSVPRRRATSDPGIPAGHKPPVVRLRRAVQPRQRHVWLLILKSWHLILNSRVRNNALSWSPVTESNRRPSPYHGDALPTELTGPIFSYLTWGFVFPDRPCGRAQRWYSFESSILARLQRAGSVGELSALRAVLASEGRHGHVSKQGPAWLRWAMNQAAQARMPPLMAASSGNFWRPTVKL